MKDTPITKPSLTPGVEKMEIAHFVDQFTWASTGMFSFKPKTAGRCYDTFGRAEIYEPSGLMPFVLTNGTLANEKNRSQRWD
ncbi:hypothetical protein GCG54_00014360 [Colletotrichum gloeosporioides]|uniref:Uncharacterized protein n=1 Tax=Colletotrichum gloeosporioides TaxID=474922 RepID=A0A8H4C538_COLGL|nr:uncharacterized protein GCG54_00014360 [Colletotrichum gloeosporioides]KAF3797500.1 hypothetical protein GCG54_00014360 [Colletotrichum gloeosporioides]